MKVVATSLPEIREIVPKQYGDHRGFFSETWNSKSFAEHGLDLQFCQDNHSLSVESGVLRGLHYQIEPFAQDKLVRVVRGAVFDVAVDIRHGSENFGKWVGVELSATKWNQVLIPKGFAHGFLTLEPNTEVIYKVTAPYSAMHDRSIRFDDPAIGIDWPIPIDERKLSAKDLGAPILSNAENTFSI